MTPLSFDNKDILTRIEEWTSSKYDEATRQEIQALVDAEAASELEDRFYQQLKFGTGGLRGKLGAGTNRMNSYIVGRATQGLANYVREHATKEGPLRAAISHDSRHRSREFAESAACVLAANGFYVHLSPELRPTPYLSFAVRELGCHTGIMITASHNPKEYNGYKVYWDDGSQVIPPHDKGIIEEVRKITSDEQVKTIGLEEGIAKGLIKLMGDEMDIHYIGAVGKQQRDKETARSSDLKLVYTPLHGVGGTLTPKALESWGFKNIICEPEQMKPDGDFPTAASPNPEEGAALDRAIKLAQTEDADLVLATDPDADRLGTAIKTTEGYRLLTGNQICVLIADYLIHEYLKKNESDVRKPGIVTTIVTSPLVEKVAASLGADCPLTLTGFKWIAEQVRQWNAGGNSSPEFLFGCEESYGYLIGDHCLDKDGVVATCLVSEMAASAKANDRTLLDRLLEIFVRCGVHYEWQKAITLPGAEGSRKIKAILDQIRENPPSRVGSSKVARFTRVDTGEILNADGSKEKLHLPSSDVFIFDLEDGSRAIARPSGTEPKIKFYFFLTSPEKPATVDRAAEIYEKLKKSKEEFEKEFLQAIGYTD